MKKNIILKIAAVFVAVFGLVSLFMTTAIIFDLFNLRTQEKNYVPFIVYANFICSFSYLFAAYGFLVRNRFTTTFLFIASGILIISYIGFIFYINYGGLYEAKTVTLMLIRIAITIFLAGISWYYITRTRLMDGPSSR